MKIPGIGRPGIWHLSGCALAGEIGVQRRGQAETTGNRQKLASDISGVIAGQIDHCCGDFLRQTHSAKGDMTQKQLPKIVSQALLDSVCSGHSGKDGVAAYVVCCFLDGNQPGQIIDCCFAGAIGYLGEIGNGTADRGYIDDTAAVLKRHLPNSFLACQKNALQI